MFRLKRRLRNLTRQWRFFWQRRFRGWDDSELWSLDYHIAKFTLPRLKRFREKSCRISVPLDMSPEEWENIVDKMIYGLWTSTVFIADDEFDSVDWDLAAEGRILFGKYFRELWW